MKLLRHGNRGKEKPGIEFEGIRFDCSKFFKDWDNEFFENNGLKELERIVNSETLNQVRDTERWGAPIARPGMVMCVGLNYKDHAAESGLELPTEPILFMKASNTVSGPFDPIYIPVGAEKIDWEVELGIVIGKNIYNLESEEEAEEAIAGYTVVNDLSERKFQLESGGQWAKGKSCPGFCPVGPYLVTKDEIEDVLSLNMTLSIGEEVMQNSNTSKMVFSPAYLVKYISQFMTLEAGDLINTGTPAGVGLGLNPPRYLQKGETMSLEIEHLGKQEQYLRESPFQK